MLFIGLNGGAERGALDIVSAALWVGLFWFAAYAHGTGALPSRSALAIALAFLPYGWLVLRPPSRIYQWVLVAALPAAFIAPVLSDDLYRYLWDGRVALSGVDPYAHAPSSAELASLRDGLWEHINNPTLATIYPPAAQLIFAFARLLGGVVAFKALALGAHLVVTVLLEREAGARAAAAFAFNPLALSESALSGHVDVFAGLALLAAVLLAKREAFHRAAAAALVAVGVKLIGLLALPSILRRRPSALWALVIAGLMLVPVARAGYADEDASAGAVHYAGRWSGNGLVFRALESATVAAVESAVERPERIVLPTWMPQELWRAFDREKKPRSPGSVPASMLASLLARLLVAGLLLLAVLLRLRAPPLEGVRDVVFCALLLAPQVHPWYLLWLLPLEAALGRRSAFVWSAAIMVAYIPLDGWATTREWRESSGFVAMEFFLVAFALLVEWRTRSKKTTSGDV